MSRLPVVSANEAIRAFSKIEFVEVRQKGSHRILRKEAYPNLLSVPDHGRKPLKTGTLRSLIRDAGLTVEQFCALL